MKRAFTEDQRVLLYPCVQLGAHPQFITLISPRFCHKGAAFSYRDLIKIYVAGRGVAYTFKFHHLEKR